MILGFIGVGAITDALVRGLCASERPPERIVISPRNAERAAMLANTFERVEIAADNQAVIDASDVACIAVRPDIARDVMGALRFRVEQSVVSLLPTFALAEIKTLTAPARDVCRLLPLPCAARREGPIAIHPAGHTLGALFTQVGALVEAEREDEFAALLASSALMASFFAAQGRIADWLAAHEVSETAARRYVAHMTVALAYAATDENLSYAELATDHTTPGGLNAQALRELREAGVYAALGDTLDLIHRRIRGQAGFENTLKDATS